MVIGLKKPPKEIDIYQFLELSIWELAKKNKNWKSENLEICL
jgi:hypothetical protein